MDTEIIEQTCKHLAKRVAPMYKVVDWKWLGEPVTEQMIYTGALDLLYQLLAMKPLTKRGRGTTSIGSGGLEAHRWREEGIIRYSITFGVTEFLSN